MRVGHHLSSIMVPSVERNLMIYHVVECREEMLENYKIHRQRLIIYRILFESNKNISIDLRRRLLTSARCFFGLLNLFYLRVSSLERTAPLPLPEQKKKEITNTETIIGNTTKIRHLKVILQNTDVRNGRKMISQVCAGR